MKWLVLALMLVSFTSTLPAQNPSGIRQTEEGVLLDVQDVDLRIVIAALAEAGGLNVVYNDLPPRRVTMRLNRAVPRTDVLALLRNIVESSGLGLREEGSVIRIVAPEVQPVPPPNIATPQGGGVQLFVYRLKHAPAPRLASTLQSLFGLATTSGGDGPAAAPSLSEQLRGQQVPPGIPAPSQQSNAPSEVTVIGSRVQGEVQIVPDELTNSVLVRANSADWQVIRNAIEALDLRPLQVLVEVLIAEVRRSSLFDLGISIKTPLHREPHTGAKIGGELISPSSGDVAIKILNLGRVEADVLISALYSRSDVTILSRPVILAQNNQEARIMVGSERPFIQVFRALPSDNAVRDQVVQYRDVGNSLRIRPTINYDNYVSLDLLQEVSTATSEVQFGAPVISTREAATKLLVRNGQTAVIGGLADRQEDKTRGGIPVLRDIPLIGRLFGSTHDNKLQTEMFLFITPHIVSSDEDVDRMRSELEKNTQLLKKQLPESKPLIKQPE